MGFWKPLRLLLLATISGGVIWTFGKSILTPKQTQQAERTFVFPTSVPLSEWELLGSEAVASPSGQIYRYRQNSLKLTLEVNYVADAKANERFFRQYNPNRLSTRMRPIVRRHGQTGFYSLSTEHNRAYLRTCINPRGQSTITYEQFMRNRYINDLQLNRLLSWLQGQVTLRDHRCLWTHLSVPVKGKNPDSFYQTLETVWVPWYGWWHRHFPEP